MMHSAIRVAVRINTVQEYDNSESFIQTGPIDENSGIHYIQAGPHLFPVSFVCPYNISQHDLYDSIIHYDSRSLLDDFLDGYDVSFITYGQKGTGKSYTIFGPGIHCASSELEHGIIPRTLRGIFSRLNNLSERNFVMNISCFQLINTEINDLLGNISCNVRVNNASEAFYWLQKGLTNISKSDTKGHLLFTISLEQQWINEKGLIQHHLSTMSFCDLLGTERSLITNQVGEQLSVPGDHGLRMLERVIHTLSNPNIYKYPNYQNLIPYDQSILTTVLMDSIGGRAKTTLICCVSPLITDLSETISNLQVMLKVQNIRNNVIINTFSDNNTPVENQGLQCKETDTFGLQFAANQWLKLVANAEGLFSRLLSDKVLAHHDAEQIEEWLFLKQECEECLSSGENITKQLGAILEEQPQNFFDSASEFLDVEEHCKFFNENEYHSKFPGEVLERSENLSDMETLEQSDTDSHKTVELKHSIENLIKNFRIMTDTLTKDRFEHFILIQPRSIFNSTDTSKSLAKASINSEPLYTRSRRRSVNPGQSLSSIELQILRRAASSGSAMQAPASDLDLKEPLINDLELLKIKCNNAVSELQSTYKQIKAIKETISLKTQLLTELMKNNDTRVHAKQKFTKKKSRLEYDLANARKNLVQAINCASNHNNAESEAEIEKWKILADHYEHRLKDICDISGFTGSGKQQLEKLHCSLEGLKKQLDALQIQGKEIKKLKINLEKDIKNKKKNEQIKKSEKKSLKDVTSRISHLDQVLKQKSLHLLHAADTAEQKSVRTEIQNLRKTRDHLQVQRTRLKGLKSPDMLQQRRLLEWDEAIEAIDTAIEVKNERICGRTSILDSNSKRHDEGERMLTARLNKLTLTETRTLLYKYFQKVIDLKDSGRKMEKQLLRLEAQQESWKHALNDAVREAILKGERNVVYLQHQHQQRLNLLLRHLTDETSASSNAERDGLVARHIPYELTTYEAQSNNTKIKQPYCKELGLYTERPFDKGLKEPKKFFTRLLQTSTGPTTKVTREKNKLIIQQNNR